jgi:hypothetical protein
MTDSIVIREEESIFSFFKEEGRRGYYSNGRLNINVAPFPPTLFSPHILPP